MVIEGNLAAGEAPGTENTFSYTYSAPQQNEIIRIREKYLPREETPLEQLRRLDADCTKKATALALAAGTSGALVLGVGMCCCMVWGGWLFVPGLVIGIAGLAGAGAAYPMYNRIAQKQRQQIAPEILKLTDVLLR